MVMAIMCIYVAFDCNTSSSTQWPSSSSSSEDNRTPLEAEDEEAGGDGNKSQAPKLILHCSLRPLLFSPTDHHRSPPPEWLARQEDANKRTPTVVVWIYALSPVIVIERNNSWAAQLESDHHHRRMNWPSGINVWPVNGQRNGQLSNDESTRVDAEV